MQIVHSEPDSEYTLLNGRIRIPAWWADDFCADDLDDLDRLDLDRRLDLSWELESIRARVLNDIVRQDLELGLESIRSRALDGILRLARKKGPKRCSATAETAVAPVLAIARPSEQCIAAARTALASHIAAQIIAQIQQGETDDDQ